MQMFSDYCKFDVPHMKKTMLTPNLSIKIQDGIQDGCQNLLFAEMAIFMLMTCTKWRIYSRLFID